MLTFVVAEKLVVLVPATPAVTRAVDVSDANAVEVEVVVHSNPGSNELEVTVQHGNNLENWSPAGSAEPVNSIGTTCFERSGIPSRYVRLSCESPLGIPGDKIVLSASLETKRL
jgi:hypothetical protein